MINLQKQIDYWQATAGEDLLNAKIMIENKRYLPALFYCHLATEKMLKALVVKVTKDHAPKTHNLIRLSELAKIEFDHEQNIFISEIQSYQLEGRYSDNYPQQPSLQLTNNYYQYAIKLNTWLRTKL